MPRRKRERKLVAPPSIKGMSVFGMSGSRQEEVILHFEEYETIKLLDYEGMNQEEAAVCMEISRPTLTRVYETARQKVAKAMVEGKDLLIRGGDFQFGDNWFCCSSCKAKFTVLGDQKQQCPVCGSSDLVSLNAFYQNE